MATFTEAGIKLSDVLAALVSGGNALAAQQGARKQRRRVPHKQEALVRLVGDLGTVGLDDLSKAFSKEWARIAKRRERQATLLAKRDFFRNIADLVGRINAALVASYRDPGTGSVAVRGVEKRYVGFVFDYQEFTVSWTAATDIARLVDSIPQTSERQHVPMVAATTQDIYGGDVMSSEERARAVDRGSEASGTESSSTGRPTIEVTEDPVTGVWSFDLEGHQVEIERKHGLVKIDGRVHKASVVKGLQDVQDLSGRPLEFVAKLVSQATTHPVD